MSVRGEACGGTRGAGREACAGSEWSDVLCGAVQHTLGSGEQPQMRAPMMEVMIRGGSFAAVAPPIMVIDLPPPRRRRRGRGEVGVALQRHKRLSVTKGLSSTKTCSADAKLGIPIWVPIEIP